MAVGGLGFGCVLRGAEMGLWGWGPAGDEDGAGGEPDRAPPLPRPHPNPTHSLSAILRKLRKG